MATNILITDFVFNVETYCWLRNKNGNYDQKSTAAENKREKLKRNIFNYH